jgi:hypothetical protein
MARISPLAWLSVGALITIVSLWLGGKVGLFVYAGAAFIAIGAFKLFAWYMTRPAETKAEQAAAEQQVSAPAQRIASQYVNCARCGQLTYAGGNFCHSCGTPIKPAAPAGPQQFDPAAYLQRLRR